MKVIKPSLIGTLRRQVRASIDGQTPTEESTQILVERHLIFDIVLQLAANE